MFHNISKKGFVLFCIFCFFQLPAFVDGDFGSDNLFEVASYLVNKYGVDQDHQLYPKCPEVRGRVDRKINFGTLLSITFCECLVSSFSW
jgi:hypothetical protein